MKKSLIAAASAAALMVGAASPAWAFLDDNTAVAVSVLGQAHTNNAPVNTFNAVAQAQANVLNNNFGNNSFQGQVLSQNNNNSGTSSALQGATTSAIAVSTNSF